MEAIVFGESWVCGGEVCEAASFGSLCGWTARSLILLQSFASRSYSYTLCPCVVHLTGGHKFFFFDKLCVNLIICGITCGILVLYFFS